MFVEKRSRVARSFLEGRICDGENNMNDNVNKKHLGEHQGAGSVLSASGSCTLAIIWTILSCNGGSKT